MKPETRKLSVRLLCLGAGLMDSSSGLLLMFAPALALKLMVVPVPSAEALVFVRFVGAFVFAVGMVYLAAFARQFLCADHAFVRYTLVATGWIRLNVCLFSGTMILLGSLSWQWATVPVTDGALALIQFALVAAGWVQRGN
jgi:hypothetical protein